MSPFSTRSVTFTTGIFAAFIFSRPGATALKSTGTKTAASGRFVMTSSIWLI